MARSPGGSGRQPPVLKKFGQHFLTDKNILSAIVDALAPTRDDVVVEVGPGRGSLTDILVERSGRVIAIEIDRALAANLREKYRHQPDVEIVEGDFLDTDLRAVVGEPYLLIGNVPYYITTPIIFKSLEPPVPRRAVFLVQREFADRLTAAPGGKEYGALSVGVQSVAQVERLFVVRAGAFHPPPKVDSAVVRIVPRKAPLVSPDEHRRLRTFLAALFSQRRKQIVRGIRSVTQSGKAQAEELLRALGIDPSARAEVLTVRQLVDLFRRVLPS